MGRKRHAIGAPGDDTVPSLKRSCFPGKGMCLISGMEYGLEEPGSIQDGIHDLHGKNVLI